MKKKIINFFLGQIEKEEKAKKIKYFYKLFA